MLALTGVLAATAVAPAPAVAGYQFTVVATADQVLFKATDAANARNFSSVIVPPNSSKLVFVEKTAWYKLAITVCGKTHDVDWNAKTNGVIVTVRGCNSFTFKE
ncbi:MAG TPA: hypothetical protein VIJ12_11535 [Candidatus Baltobacteraceae bacterium]